MADSCATILYVVLIYQVNSQYVDIWYDNMSSQNGWNATNSADVYFSYYSNGCINEACAKTGTKNHGYSGIDKSTDISGYSYIQLKFDGSSAGFEDTHDRCEVHYAYDSRNNKQFLNDYDGFPKERKYFTDQVFSLPLDKSAKTLWIFFETTGDLGSADNCYWDNVYLRGVPFTITQSPTNNPTNNPITMPTNDPSSHPTNTATPEPTTSPTNDPSLSPTNNPTLSPTRATNHPTTPSPTEPGVLVCGDIDTGTYNGEILAFIVNLTHESDLIFDASSSWFAVTIMEATNEFGSVVFGNDHDNDEIITLYNMNSGNYKFSIYGGTQTDLQYEVKIICPTSETTPLTSKVISTIVAYDTLSTFDALNEEKTYKSAEATRILIIVCGAVIIILVWLCVILLCNWNKKRKAKQNESDIKKTDNTERSAHVASKPMTINEAQQIELEDAQLEKKMRIRAKYTKGREAAKKQLQEESENSDDDIYDISPLIVDGTTRDKDISDSSECEEADILDTDISHAVIHIVANSNKKQNRNEFEIGVCSDCVQYKNGKFCEGDGSFYCDECWSNLFG